MGESVRKPNLLLGLIGGVIGGVAGYYALFWILKYHYYALVLPPGLLGLGVGLCARGRSILLAIVSALAGLSLALFIEWKLRHFNVDSSLWYFLTHIHEVNPVELIMLIVGPIIAFRLGLGFDQKRGS
jgi:hypothetical protein